MPMKLAVRIGVRYMPTDILLASPTRSIYAAMAIMTESKGPFGIGNGAAVRSRKLQAE